MRTCIEVCPDCPLIPEGIAKAAIVAIDVPDIGRMAGLRLFAENERLTKDVENSISVTFQAIEVEPTSDYEQKDEGRTYIDGRKFSEEDVAQAFENCKGPKQNLIQKLAGVSVCGAFRR